MQIPLAVKTSFEFSPALQAHIERRLDRALAPHTARVRRVELRLSDANGPKHGPTDKLARLIVRLVPSGQIVATAESDDLYDSVSQAIARARAALTRRLQHLGERR